jgi:cytochrome c
MDDRFNTTAGWVLGAGIVALGATLLTGQLFAHHKLEKGGYPVAEAEGGGGGTAAAKPVDWAVVDAAKGADVFKQCVACHTIDAGGANGTGPNLHAILGKGKAAVGGFAYSDALKGKGGSWMIEDMDQWLISPRKFAPGTKMTYAGLSDPEKRGNLIAYLNGQGSNLAYPKSAAPAEAAAAPAADGAKADEAAAAPANATAPANAAEAAAK